MKGTEMETSGAWINDDRKNEHEDVDGYYSSNKLVTFGDPGYENIIFQSGCRFIQATKRADIV